MIGKNQKFIDLDQGRVGTFVGKEIRADRLYVRYVPPNCFTVKEIKNLERNALLDPIQIGNETIFILVKGESGTAEILEEHLNSKVPKLMAQIAEYKRKENLRRGVQETYTRTAGRGFESELKERMRAQKIMTPHQTRDDDQKRKRGIMGGDSFGQQ